MHLTAKDAISVPDYSDGITEFGRLVATRACRTDNSKFSRFILFAETENREHYRVVRGSELGPGGAKALRGEGYVADPKSRRPDTYAEVTYANKAVDWLSRTALTQLVGQKYTE